MSYRGYRRLFFEYVKGKKKTSFSEDRRYIENGSEETECREPRIQSLGHIRMRGRVLSPEISTNWILIGLIRGATKLRVWN